MTKTELVEKIAEKANLTKKDADSALKAAIETITDELKAGGKVQLVGFATFSVKERAERQGKNLRTGEKITIPAKKVAHCKMAKVLD